MRISNLRIRDGDDLIALEAGVPTIVAIDSTSVTDYSWLIDQIVVAVLLMTYNGRIDGTAIQGFDRLVNPKVLPRCWAQESWWKTGL